MKRILLASLQGHARRFIAGGLAIVLGVGFVSAVLIAIGSAKAGIENAVGEQYKNAGYVVYNPVGEQPDSKRADRVRAVDGVAAVAVSAETYGRMQLPNGARRFGAIQAIPQDKALRWQQVESGRLPTGPGEVAVSTTMAKDKRISAGDRIRFSGDAGSEAGKGKAPVETLKVVGTVKVSSLVSQADLFAPEPTVAALNNGELYGDLLVRLDSPNVDKRAIAAAAGKGMIVQTGPDKITATVAALTGGIDILGGLLLGFTAIAMFVAMLVVANTFTIVIAQRARELALFRCVGAAKNQVFKAVLAESVIIGLVASAIGIGVGIGIAKGALGLVDAYVDQPLPLDDIVLSVSSIVIPVVIGTVTTMLAALAPARRATRVPPLAALHPEAAIRVRSKAGAFRIVVGVLFLVAGGGLMALGMASTTGGPSAMLLGVGGGLVSFLGVLLFAPILVPAVVGLLGLAARTTGVPGRVSADNAIRNPRRTAATASALLVGVTLISILVVGAASSQATSNRTLDNQFPIDLTVIQHSAFDPSEPAPDALSPGSIAAVKGIDGVQAVAPMRVGVAGLGKDKAADGMDVYGVDPAQAMRTLRNPRPLQGLAPGTVVLGKTLAHDHRVRNGDPIKLNGDQASLTLKVRVIKEENTPDVIVTEGDLAQLVAKPAVSGLLAKVDPGVDYKGLNDRLGAIFRNADEGLEIGGSAPERGLYAKIIDGMLLVAVGLLAISVMIALVGVGNTLSLSVLERTRENALLRALGLTRGQLRSTLAVEALLIAGSAVVIGLGLGLLYGFIGTQTIFAGVTAASGQVELAIPWTRLALVALVALVAGVLASVLPARRAVKTPPSAALTAE